MKKLTVVALSVLIAGCGDTVIDGDKLEDEIVNDAEAAGLVVDAADCPSPDAEEGDVFNCTVTVKGEDKDLEITQEDDEGNLSYDLAPLVSGDLGPDAGGDVASVTSVIEAVNGDVTALCDYSTEAYKQEIVDQTGQATCEDAVASGENDPIEDFEVDVQGDTATVTGTDSSGEVVVSLERAEDNTWEISAIR